MNREWTKNQSGVADQSSAYLHLIDVVAKVLLHSGDRLVRGDLRGIADAIVYRLVHDYNVGPYEAIRDEIEQTAIETTNEELNELSLEKSR